MKKFFYIILFFPFFIASCVQQCPDGDCGDNGTIVPPDSDTYTSNQARSTKRGICYNGIYATDFDMLSQGICWAYNWAASSVGFGSALQAVSREANIVYIPIWQKGGVPEAAIRNYKNLYPEAEWILALNEPTITNEANMTPEQAAVGWVILKSLAQELNMKIAGPTMSYGNKAGWEDPIVWLDAFFAQPGVSLDDISALPIHCYYTNVSQVKSFVERFRKYGKPIWMTEFCYDLGQNPSVDMHKGFMSNVLNYFETDPLIERYSWFMFDPGNAGWENCAIRLRSNANTGKFTDLGKVYIHFSSMDKSYHYGHNQVVPAEHYSNCNSSENVGAPDIAASVSLNVSSDTTGILEVTSFGVPKWLEYKIEPITEGNYNFIIRYASNGDSKMKIMAEGRELGEIDLPKTGGYTTWATITTSAFPLNAGKQDIRFATSKGMVSLNWWRYKKQ